MNRAVLILMVPLMVSLVLAGCENAQMAERKLGSGNDSYGVDSYDIIDVHEQIATIDQVPRFLGAMDKAGVDKVVLLGSPDATFIYQEGFRNHHINNRELMKIAKENPGRFIVFPTIDPREPSEVDALKQYISDGAAGLRLFSGQFAWYYRFVGPVNRTEVYPSLDYCRENNIPIMWNMNPGKGTLQAEFEDVLRKYPGLRIVCPHFCLSSINSSRLEYLMDNYPNLYTDISFGHFFEDGLERISRNVTKFRGIFWKYRDRILFGADLVITGNTIPESGDPSEWIYNLTMCYRDMLEKEKYNCSVHIKKVFDVDKKNLNGLGLDEEALRKIYNENPRRWIGHDDV